MMKLITAGTLYLVSSNTYAYGMCVWVSDGLGTFTQVCGL